MLGVFKKAFKANFFQDFFFKIPKKNEIEKRQHPLLLVKLDIVGKLL
jgi:hypothetical protein